MRRAIDSGTSPWWALLFFVPYLNDAAIAALCALPSRFEGPFADQPPRVRDEQPKYLIAMLPGLVLGLAMIGLSVYWLRMYGIALYFATPFGIGAITAWSLNRGACATQWQTTQLVSLTLGLLAALLLGLGREGAVCLAMARPLGLALGLMGGRLGSQIAIETQELRGSFRSATHVVVLHDGCGLSEVRADRRQWRWRGAVLCLFDGAIRRTDHFREGGVQTATPTRESAVP